MPDWTLKKLLGALRPLNMTRESSKISRPHDSLRNHFAELEFGIVFPLSTSGVEALLTSAGIGVRASAAWLEHKCCFFFTKKLRRESLQSHHAVHVNWLRLPLPLRLLCFGIVLWQVAVVHRFHCRSDVSRGNERVSLPRRLRGRLWPRVSTWRASSPSSVFFTRVVVVCGVATAEVVRSGRCFSVCVEVKEDLSLSAVLWRMCFPFEVVVALSTFTSQNVRLKGDLVAGLRHVARFSLCSPARLSIGGFTRSFSSFEATVLSQGVHGERPEGTAFAALRDPAWAGRCARGRHGR